jgi:hypothetical protein
MPQLMVAPQPSPTEPQLAFAVAQVSGVHGGTPHWFGTPPPPQLLLPVHMPHETVAPQPSPMVPQFAFACMQVRGVHGAVPHTLVMPPPPHVCPAAHGPPHEI